MGGDGKEVTTLGGCDIPASAMQTEEAEGEELLVIEKQRDNEVEEILNWVGPDVVMSELEVPGGTSLPEKPRELPFADIPKIWAEESETAMRKTQMKEADIETMPFVEDPSTVVDVEMATASALVEHQIERVQEVWAAHRFTSPEQIPGEEGMEETALVTEIAMTEVAPVIEAPVADRQNDKDLNDVSEEYGEYPSMEGELEDPDAVGFEA